MSLCCTIKWVYRSRLTAQVSRYHFLWSYALQVVCSARAYRAFHNMGQIKVSVRLCMDTQTCDSDRVISTQHARFAHDCVLFSFATANQLRFTVSYNDPHIPHAAQSFATLTGWAPQSLYHMHGACNQCLKSTTVRINDKFFREPNMPRYNSRMSHVDNWHNENEK